MDLKIIGIIDKKLIVSFKGKEVPIAFYLQDRKLIYRYDVSDDNKKFIKYGYGHSLYAEFVVPNSEKIFVITNKEIFQNFHSNSTSFIENLSKNYDIISNIIAVKIKNNGEIQIYQIDEILKLLNFKEKEDL